MSERTATPRENIRAVGKRNRLLRNGPKKEGTLILNPLR